MPTREASPSAPADDLAAEQRYLEQARTDLRAMRERTLSLEATTGDAQSAEYLKFTLFHRAKALEDDPSTALFFGRIDTAGGAHAPASTTALGPERWYIGRRHVGDAAGNPVVIDWRAAVSTAFYRASHADPMGVTLRRRFGLDHGRITGFEDEHLTDPGEAPDGGEGAAPRSQILADEIERPRVGPMRDIVATIQPEQDEIVRADASTSVVVQGAPGTGKTAVGLHRAAWLLYAFREKLDRGGVLVIGPNDAFLAHVGAVLPTLGEVRVGHTTIEHLLARRPVRGADTPEVATLKGDARLAEVIRRAVWAHVPTPEEALVVPRGVRKWRLPAYEVAEIVEELKARGVRYEAARQMLPKRLAHAVLLLMERAGDSPDDRVQDAVTRSAPVRAYCKAAWPALDAEQVVVELLSDPEALAAAADGVLTADEQASLLWAKPPRSKGAARWSVADLALLDEAADQIERMPSLAHVVLDEAQDLSPLQLRAVGRRASTGAVTVLGDIAQGTTPWATRSWAESLRHLGKPDGHIEELVRGFRVPARVIEFAARLLPHMAPGLAAPESVRDNPGELVVTRVAPPAVPDAVVDAAQHALAGEGSVGVIAAPETVPVLARALTDAGLAFATLEGPNTAPSGGRRSAGPATDPASEPSDEDVAALVDETLQRLHVVDSQVAKGLEYDRVIVVEPADIAAAEPDERTGLRRLYVVLTRAVTSLTVVHAQPLPAELGDGS